MATIPTKARLAFLALGVSVLPMGAQEPNFHPVAQSLGPEDRPVFPVPPAGFDVRRESIPHGRTELRQYASKTVGTQRKLLVYTPPSYDPKASYDVLYLLHGIGGDELEWQKCCAPEAILDNLMAEKKIKPMIVVFPNGRAQANDRAEGNIYQAAPAFENFTGDLLNDVIPFIEANYLVKKGPEHRALGGLSMGGGQTLNIGLSHPETFGWVGGFSSAPNTRSPLFKDANTLKSMKLIYIACGDNDGLLSFSQRAHGELKKAGINHIWHINPGKHEPEVWKMDLYHYSQLLFK